jgi:DNA-binding transcriptional LysR family regulator
MTLNIRELDVFRRVMEHGTITAAAESLHVSQPVVSRILQQAEARLGFALFVRRKRRLLPTIEARVLLPETVSAFAAFDNVQRRIKDVQEGRAGAITIATISAFANALLPAAIQRFRATCPRVTISLQAMTALQVATLVANNQADIGFIIDSVSVPGIAISDLCATEFGCVMPRRHRLAKREQVTAADLEDETLICLGRHLPLGVQAMRVFADANIPLHIAVEVSQATIACALVRAGVGVALLDGMGLMGARASDLVMRPFHPRTKIAARLVQPRHFPPSPVVREFVKVLRQILTESASQFSGRKG